MASETPNLKIGCPVATRANRHTAIINLVSVESIQGNSPGIRTARACERPHRHHPGPPLVISMAPQEVGSGKEKHCASISDSVTRALICDSAEGESVEGESDDDSSSEYSSVDGDSWEDILL